MADASAVTAVVLVGMLVLVFFGRRFSRLERQCLWAGFGAHILAAFCQIWMVRYFYGGGDMLRYYRQGRRLADWATADFVPHTMTLLQVFFQLTSSFDPVGIIVHGIGGSTGSMYAASALSSLLLGGSLYAMGVFWSLFAFAGQVMIYLGFRGAFRARFRPRLLVAALLIPSVVFWSAGLIKEAFAVGGLGFLFLGIQRLICQQYKTRYLVAAGFGGFVIAIFKAYILFPFFLAGGVWYYWYRSLRQRGSVAILSKPLYLVFGACIAIGAVVVFGQLFPQYAPSTIGERIAQTRYHQLQAGGGSEIDMKAARGASSLAAQLPLVPLALVTALFRPFLIEAHNALALINSLETTVVLGLVVWILGKRGLVNTYRTIADSPATVFCLVFVLLFATAVGLAAPNLGTMSRYRIPMMPFYLCLLLLLVPFGGANR